MDQEEVAVDTVIERKGEKMNEKLKNSVIKSGKSLWSSMPVLAGVVLLVGLANTLISKSAYGKVFTGDMISDSIIGSALGSVLAGTPVTSYVLGGELLNQGISLVAVTAFLVAWVTVGFVQLPAESIMLGKRFAVSRNILSFIFSIIVATITVFVLGFV